MLRHLFQRFLLTALWLVLILVFLMIHIVHGDLGQSLKFQAPVRRIIFDRYPTTLQLAPLALLVCAAIPIPAGVLAAYRRSQTPDRTIGGCARSE